MDHPQRKVIAHTNASTRRSALSLVIAAIAGNASNTTGEAKTKGPDCGKSAEERCKSDTETCRAIMMAGCQDSPEACLPLAACCDTCSANGLFTCLLAQQEASTTARNALRMT